MSDRFGIGIEEIVAVMHRDLLRNYDVCAVIDADIHYRQGMVGQGKSSFGLILSLMINPRFWPPRDMTVKDDYRHFFLTLHRKYPYSVTMWDEMGAFFNKQVWAAPYVKTSTYNFIVNRKDYKVWIGCVPWFWWNVEQFRLHRPQWRFKIRNRTEIEVYEHNGYSDQSEDRWGKYITTIEGVPGCHELFPSVWHQYEKLNDAHPRIHTADKGCIEGMMGMPAARVWPIIEGYWNETQNEVSPSPSMKQSPPKEEKRSKPPEKRPQKAIPRETFPLMMNRPKEEA